MPLDRRKFLTVAPAVATALGFTPNLSLDDAFAQFLVGITPQIEETNMSKELADLVDANYNSLPRTDASTSYGTIKHYRQPFGETFADLWNQSRYLNAPDRVTPDTIEESISLDTPSSRISATIARKESNKLSLNVFITNRAPYSISGYIDYEFDGKPNRVMRDTNDRGLHGFNDSDFINADKMPSEEAKIYTQKFEDGLRKVIGAFREYLKVENQPIKP